MDPRRRAQSMEGAMQPFDQGQARMAADPFSMMDAMFGDMMMMPFGGSRGGGMGGRGMFGGGLFDQMDQMMMAAGSQGGGGGFSCQTMCFSSTMGPDGQMHTEKFASSTVGDHDRRIRETQQAYSNSSSGVDKMSLERQMGDQGRKMVKERSRTSGDEVQTQMFRGITEDQANDFDQRWGREAAPHLPRHAPPQAMLAAGASSGGHRGYSRAQTMPQAIDYGDRGGRSSRPYSGQPALPSSTVTPPNARLATSASGYPQNMQSGYAPQLGRRY